VSEIAIPATGTAAVHVLHEGYVGLDGDDERVSGTVTLITDVVFSHHHPDHTVNAALFPNARIHDHWAVYQGDRWISEDAQGKVLAPSVRLLRTPGHTREDISTIASAPDGVYACTHAWWTAQGPEEDPLGADQAALTVSRALLLASATVIIPGHGAAFRPGGHL
jgi:glyoxylase-like metal-dependent hydrolase (beta-lactamase superfamily II)